MTPKAAHFQVTLVDEWYIVLKNAQKLCLFAFVVHVCVCLQRICLQIPTAAS